ncbi:SURF1 family cytochrome oxidase biogenesis protein [Sphingosinicella sp.]|uniref:SURF1 family cytochrome oxidase biogenesis protein n=1 Tax=Sphingosinicella sp. TaxID=1917971 RepID=UPI004037A85B
MRRPPLIPTLVVAGAVAVMIGLGIWQLERAAWKERLLADYAAAAALPALDLDPLLTRDAPVPPLAFRRALVSCRSEALAPVLRGGRSRAGQSGYVSLVPCRPGASGLAGRLLVNAGWSALPDQDRRLSLGGIVAGTLGADLPGEPLILTAATPAPPLAASAPASIEDVPNNHRLYAAQWFFFAGLAVLIYVLALRRRRAPSLPPEP